MTQSFSIKFNPQTHEIEIEGSEAFVKKYFDIVQKMLAVTPATVKDKAAPRKRRPNKATAAAKPAKKMGAKKVSMTEKIIALVQQGQGGVSVDNIIKKTKAGRQQAWNILSKAKKEGKISSVGRGVYGPGK